MQAVSALLAGWARSKTAENIIRDLRNRLFDHIQHLSFPYHDNINSGELIQRSTSDIDMVRQFYANQIPGLARILFMFIINFIAVLILDYRLALFSVSIIPVIVVVSIFFFGKIYKAYSEHQDQEGLATSFAKENLSGIRVVRAFARQKEEKHKFDKINSLQRDRGFKVAFWHTMYWPVSHMLCGIQWVSAVFFGAILTLQDPSFTPGMLVTATFLFNSMIWPVQDLGRIVTEISRGYVSFTRINTVLKERKETVRDKARIKSGSITGEIVFKNVWFYYVKGNPVLKDISFTCRSGETIALIGSTGSGKSTLINLLPRFYENKSGEIYLDGHPLNKYNRQFLRTNIGIVEQDPFLFSTTIEENISYGTDRDITITDIKKAAESAAIHNTIMSFKDGYRTMVGEKGVSLSGGQKQRIAIARAILKNPRVLILDDSTSAVDSETEARIQNALDVLMKNRTTFVIAHRAATLTRADKIIVLDKGKIVQIGTHNELINYEGFYKDIFDLQTNIEDELLTKINTGTIYE
jgi:ATP-binding cassette subfamily B protein